MNNIWNWLVKSSANPNEVALTVKGAIIGVIPVILIFLKVAGVDTIGGQNIQDFADLIGGVIVAFLSGISTIITLIGFIRKVYLTAKK